MRETLFAQGLHTGQRTIAFPVMEVEDGRIVSLEAGPPNNERQIWTAPFFDIHVHGAMGHDFMTASLPEMDAVGRFLASRGVAHYLATTVTTGVDATLAALGRLAQRLRKAEPAGFSPEGEAAAMVGIHLEGPFLCPAKRGVHPIHHLLAPSIEVYERFQQAAEGHIRLVTLAPEMPGGLALIEHLAAKGVRVSLGHSNATFAEAEAALAAGARSAPHTYNAMRGLDHREPGLLGAVLDSPALYAELICDGVHVHPAAVRLWLHAKGAQRGILVTDGMAATGMPEGTYRLGDLEVEVRGGVCLSGGALAGSVLTMDRAVANLQAFTGTFLETAVRLASHNPAEMLGLETLQSFAPGAPASFNVYGQDGQRLGSYLQGRWLPA